VTPRVGPGRPAAAAPGLLPRVQGIRSSIFDIKLRGEKLVDHVGDVLIDGTLVRKMGGASELKIEVEDTGANLLNSKLLEDGYDLTLDGLGFRFVAFERDGFGEPLVLNHEALVVARLRELHGPHKAFREEMTRAEFLRQRVMELKPPRPRFVCPELHKIQPIKDERDSRQAADDAKQRRGKGIGEASLTVKGVKATSAQIAAGDRALRIAEAEDAETRVMIAMMEALIVESLIGKVASNWMQIEPASVSGFKGDPNSLEQSVRGFLLGYNSGAEGAIEYFRKHPDAKAHEIAQAVQRSGAGLPSNGAANYGPWADEAAEWVSAYGGGSDSSITETLRYPFEEKKDENHWELGRKLAQPVNWRWFESAGWVYFIAEPTLFRSHLRMKISDSTPGVLNTSIKGDTGKSHEEVTVEAMAEAWAAPPGSVVQLRRHGPANGPYLVDRIESPLAERESICTIQLKRPSKPKKEPPNPTRTRSVGNGAGGGATTDDLAKVNITKSSPGSPYWDGTAAIFKQFVHPFMEGRGLSPGAEKEEGHANGSDHALYSSNAYATDYPASDTAETTSIANDLGRAMGRSGGSVGTYDRFEVEVDGLRFSVQILWHVPDHYDHIHVGIQRI
jgi:hypothetical protein